MKFNSLFWLFIILAFSSVSFAQGSVAVRKQKIIYTRRKPIADYKKTFTINYPKVRAATPALSQKIEKAISYQSVMGVSIEEEKTEVQWIETADYTIDYNKNGFCAFR